MLSPDEKARLETLDKRIEAAKAAENPAPASSAGAHSMAEVGWRMVSELVAGLLIGFGIGYGLDVLFGTLPVLLVVFTLLGFAAGVRVMLRTASELQERTGAASDGPGRGDERGGNGG